MTQGFVHDIVSCFRALSLFPRTQHAVTFVTEFFANMVKSINFCLAEIEAPCKGFPRCSNVLGQPFQIIPSNLTISYFFKKEQTKTRINKNRKLRFSNGNYE